MSNSDKAAIELPVQKQLEAYNARDIDAGEVDVVAIYEVKDGKIANAWFRTGLRRLHAATEIRRALPPDAVAVRELPQAAASSGMAVARGPVL